MVQLMNKTYDLLVGVIHREKNCGKTHFFHACRGFCQYLIVSIAFVTTVCYHVPHRILWYGFDYPFFRIVCEHFFNIMDGE